VFGSESTLFRQPTVSTTTANLAEGSASIPGTSVYRRSKWGRKIVRRPQRAQSDCPTPRRQGSSSHSRQA
jgi:hypothetical protein